MPLDVPGDLFRILAEVEIPAGSSLSFRIRGTPVTLTNQAAACKSDPAPVTGHVRTVEILVDRTSIETFVNEGEVSLSACFLPTERPARACQRPRARHAFAPSACSRSSRCGTRIENHPFLLRNRWNDSASPSHVTVSPERGAPSLVQH